MRWEAGRPNESMRGAVIWKLGTVVFAATTIFLLLRGPEAVSPPPSGMSAGPGRATAAHSAAPWDESAPPEPDEFGSQPGAEGPAGEVESRDSGVEPLDLVRRLLLGNPAGFLPSNWGERVARLRARAGEVVPILEDWIRRADEIRSGGVRLDAVFAAYAQLLGPAAIDLLRQRVLDRTPPDSQAAAALARIDDPEAAAILRRHQETRPPRTWGVHTRTLWTGSPASRALLREWARQPPASQPWLREEARRTIFQFGSEEDRERIWSSAGLEERYDLYPRPTWPEPWPERRRERERAGLESPDAWIRKCALDEISRHPDLYGEELAARAEMVLDEDLARPVPDMIPDPDGYRKSLDRIRGQFEKARRKAEHERKLRDLLTPR